jgi:hypothetical protein
MGEANAAIQAMVQLCMYVLVTGHSNRVGESYVILCNNT